MELYDPVLLFRVYAGSDIHEAATDAIAMRATVLPLPIALEFNGMVLRLTPKSTMQTIEAEYFERCKARQE